MSYVPQPDPSNPASGPKRNLKSTATTPSGYSASPSQLTLSSELPSSLQNPYQQAYGYAPHPNDPSQFAFSQHPQYRPPLQTHGSLQQQQQQQPPPPPPPSAQSVNPRKRRGSELDMPGSASSSASTYGHPQGLVPSETGMDVAGFGQSTSQPELPSPAAKKGRTNTPWTAAEEQRLKTLREAGSTWSEIAKTFPNRTEGSVKKHWYKDMHYAEFQEDESATLLQAIKEYENNKWKFIGQKVGKPAKACEAFAKEQGWKV